MATINRSALNQPTVKSSVNGSNASATMDDCHISLSVASGSSSPSSLLGASLDAHQSGIDQDLIGGGAGQLAYHELDEVPVKEIDPLDQLEQNIMALESLSARFQFVMKEVRYLMKIE